MTTLLSLAACLALQADPPSGALIVLNKGEATASILESPSGKELAKLKTGVGPHEAVVSPDRRTAVVSNYGEQKPGQSLTILDLEKREAVRTIDLGDYRRPHGMAFLPDGRLLVTAEVQQSLLIIDLIEGRVASALQTGQQGTHMVCLSPAADRAYTSNVGSGSVSIFDLAKGELITTIKTGAGTEAIDASPDGREIWAGNNKDHTISIIDAHKLEVIATVPCASVPIRLKFTPDGKHVLVAAIESGDIAVLSAADRKELRRIPMRVGPDAPPAPPQYADSALPIGLLITPDGRHAYITAMRSGQVAQLDLPTWEITARFTTGSHPDGVAFAPAGT